MIAVGPLLVILALLGAPLFVVIAASAMWGFTREGIDLQAIAIEFFGLAEMPILLAIPLFTFAGYLLSESGAPHRLVRLTRAVLGWMPAGLAIVSLAACAFFTAFTGASGVTIIALGAILFPALQQAGYPEKFNLGLLTSAGSLGLLFAPSLPLILYGIVARTPIDDGRGFDVVLDAFEAGPNPGESAERPTIEAVVEDLLDARRVEDRHHRVDEGELRLVCGCRGFAGVVVPHQGDHPAIG